VDEMERSKMNDDIESLLWAIDASAGEFNLILWRGNSFQYQEELASRLPHLLQLALSPSEEKLYSRIRDFVGDSALKALIVTGLESVQDLRGLFVAANNVREQFRRFPFTLVLCVNNEVLKAMQRFAPGFYSWAVSLD
jgi:hypothetical protein